MSESSVWLEGSDGRRWQIASACSIGRSTTNDIVLNDGKVSRRHALIHKQDDAEYWIIDLGSGNGTFLNGRRVTLSTRLNDKDVVTVGELSITFRQVATRTRPPSRVVSAAQTIINIRDERCWFVIADIMGSTALAARFSTTDMAMLVGRWMGACKETIEAHQGVINKYLGDGFFAYWPEHDRSNERVLGALRQLAEMQASGGEPRFRLVVHLGSAAFGGGGSLGEDSLSGLDVVQTFRMEKLAGSLRCNFLVSEPVQSVLAGNLNFADVGVHALPGFEREKLRFFAVR